MPKEVPSRKMEGYRPGSPASFSWLTLKCSAQGMLKPFSRSVSRMSPGALGAAVVAQVHPKVVMLSWSA